MDRRRNFRNRDFSRSSGSSNHRNDTARIASASATWSASCAAVASAELAERGPHRRRRPLDEVARRRQGGVLGFRVVWDRSSNRLLPGALVIDAKAPPPAA
jgi:hypothetical protein